MLNNFATNVLNFNRIFWKLTELLIDETTSIGRRWTDRPANWSRKRWRSVGARPATIHTLTPLSRDTYDPAKRRLPPHRVNCRAPSWTTAYFRHVTPVSTNSTAASASATTLRGLLTLDGGGRATALPYSDEDADRRWSSTVVKSHNVMLMCCPGNASTDHGLRAHVGASDVIRLATYWLLVCDVIGIRSSLFRWQNSALRFITANNT